LYRVPFHPTADGNTVEIGVEQAAFSQNARLPDQPHLHQHEAARAQGEGLANRGRRAINGQSTKYFHHPSLHSEPGHADKSGVPMSFKDISQIAGSAMAAQTVRLNTVASNLANADSVSPNENDTYRARKPVFAAVMNEGPNGLRRPRTGAGRGRERRAAAQGV
jgi:flagellar basal body rod protein FlgB